MKTMKTVCARLKITLTNLLKGQAFPQLKHLTITFCYYKDNIRDGGSTFMQNMHWTLKSLFPK